MSSLYGEKTLTVTTVLWKQFLRFFVTQRHSSLVNCDHCAVETCEDLSGCDHCAVEACDDPLRRDHCAVETHEADPRRMVLPITAKVREHDRIAERLPIKPVPETKNSATANTEGNNKHQSSARWNRQNRQSAQQRGEPQKPNSMTNPAK